MRLVRSPAAAKNISGDAMVSQPEEGSEFQARHEFSLRTAILVALLMPNYGSCRLMANRFRSRVAQGSGVCHARSRRITGGVMPQVATPCLRKSRSGRGRAQRWSPAAFLAA